MDTVLAGFLTILPFSLMFFGKMPIDILRNREKKKLELEERRE